MTAITTTEHHLSKKDIELADEIARGMEDVEGQMLNICYCVAKACNQREEQFIQPFLERALPSLKPSSRRNVLMAGRERMANLNSARQRASIAAEYGWTTLAEIQPIPPEHKDWAYEEKRTRQEIRDYKKKLKGTNDSVTPDQAEEKVKDYQEYATELLGVISLLQSELHDLKQQSNDTSQVFTPLPQHDSSFPTSHRATEHYTPCVEMGEEALHDFNRVHQLLDEVSAIESKYYCTGLWNKDHWESIFGAHEGASAASNAQRNYKPGSKSGPVIDV